MLYVLYLVRRGWCKFWGGNEWMKFGGVFCSVIGQWWDFNLFFYYIYFYVLMYKMIYFIIFLFNNGLNILDM